SDSASCPSAASPCGPASTEHEDEDHPHDDEGGEPQQRQEDESRGRRLLVRRQPALTLLHVVGNPRAPCVDRPPVVLAAAAPVHAVGGGVAELVLPPSLLSAATA